MFEFKDPRLGKVKVINVTEARAHIATIMQDKDFSYVITKNNKPIRLVVNYDSFQQQSDEAQPAMPLVSPSPIRGILETNEKGLDELQLKPKVRRALPTPAPESSPSPTAEEVTTLSAAEISRQLEEKIRGLVAKPEKVESPKPTPEPPSEEVYHQQFKALYQSPPNFLNQNEAEKAPSVTILPKTFNNNFETPSLEDLLKELEQEKLSGEEEPS